MESRQSERGIHVSKLTVLRSDPRLDPRPTRAGSPLPTIDSLLAATAMQHGLVLVTRKVRDVADLGAQVLNPWD